MKEITVLTFNEEVKQEICLYLTNNKLIKQPLIFSILKSIGEYNLFTQSIEFQTQYVWVVKMFKTFVNENNNDYKIEIFYTAISNDSKKTKYLVRINHIHQDIWSLIKNMKTVKREDKQIFLIGAFLASGSIIDPNKGKYHLEIKVNDEQQKNKLLTILKYFDLNAKSGFYKNKWKIYFKKSSEISDVLKLMFANNAMYQLEDTRIAKDTVNNLQRLVNLEVFNLKKISKAAVEQAKMCSIIQASYFYTSLSDREKLYCDIRAVNPKLSMQKICDLMNEQLPITQKITKGSLSHFVQKIKKIYELI